LVREVDELAITENLAGERFAQGFYDIILYRLGPQIGTAQARREGGPK